MTNQWPKYQASFFFNGSKDDQLVIRNDDKEEFRKMLIWVKQVKEVVKNGSNNTAIPEENHICSAHNVPMKPKKGKYGVFYSHSKQLNDGSWIYCKGKGWGK